jgi:ribosomal protein S18 acetylase RimI-like enzyme
VLDVPIRPFRASDAAALAELSAACVRSEADFVLNPLWESEADLFAEFRRHGIEPEEHVLVAEGAAGEVMGMTGFVRRPEASVAGLLCPIVAKQERGRGTGGELLRAALAHGPELGIKLVSASIGTRNRAGYSLLAASGFRPVRQHFLMRCDGPPPLGPAPIEGLDPELAKPDDADDILRIYEECGFEPRSLDAMRRLQADGRHVHAVARWRGEVQAFVELETHWPKRVWVAFVGVRPELRDRGVGSHLVAFALAHPFEAGAESALLLLSPSNRTAVRAYEKAGFRRHRVVDVLEKGL